MQNLKGIIDDLRAHSGEQEWFEFKMNLNNAKEIGEYISSLSNAAAMEGRENGYLVWGIENNTHAVKGTAFDYQQDVKNEPLQHYLARLVRPDIGFRFAEFTYEGKRLVILIIPAAYKTPTSFDKIRYTRIGSSKANLVDYPERESQLFDILRHGLPTIDNTASEYQDLTFNKLFVYYEAKGITLNRRTFKKNLGFLTDDGKYNILAQLLSDNSHIPIRFSLFAGNNKASTLYSVREFGNTCLLYSLDDVLQYGNILNIPQADERDRIVERKEVMLFNQEAYREAVINAFVHNRWIDGNAPMFTGYQNRIEILSHGSLAPNQTLEGFYEGVSVPVNKRLSDIILQLHISERSGRGVPKIVEVYGRDHIRMNENSISIVIPYDRIQVSGRNQEMQNDLLNEADTLVKEDAFSTKNTLDEGKNTLDGVKNTLDEGKNTLDEGKNTLDEGKNTLDGGKNTIEEEEDNLTAVGHLRTEKIENRILAICMEPKNINEIAQMLGYKEKKSVRKYLLPLLEQGRIARTIPEKPKSKKQKYITIK